MTMRPAKGWKVRLTMLAVSLIEPLRRQMVYAKSMHAEDLPPWFRSSISALWPGAKYSLGQRFLGWRLSLGEQGASKKGVILACLLIYA